MSNYMGLTTILDSDYVSPTPINNNFAKLDVLGNDYVVEKGTSGEWWFRKWKSGRAECGVDSKQFEKQKMETLGTANMYRTQYLTFGAYPFSFAIRPYVSLIFEGDLTNAGRGSFAVPQHNTSTTQSPNFFIADWDKADMQPLVGILVVGRYK